MLLKAKAAGKRVHTVALNCTHKSTVAFLKELGQETMGHFHFFSGDLHDVMEDTGHLLSKANNAEIQSLTNEVCRRRLLCAHVRPTIHTLTPPTTTTTHTHNPQD